MSTLDKYYRYRDVGGGFLGALISWGKLRKGKKIIIKSGGKNVFSIPRKPFCLYDLKALRDSSSLPKQPPTTTYKSPQ